jgi:hypothetical protein
LIKRWPRRREFLSYYLLWRTYGENPFNLGEAVELLAPVLGSRNVASRLVRRLVKQGFLVRIAPMTYRARRLTELLDEALAVYVAKRLRRQGVEAKAEKGRVVVPNCIKLPPKLSWLVGVVGADEEQCKG